MRRCPKCRVDFQVVKKPFAEIDVCPQCHGVFLDAGEGVALNGVHSDGSFLVKDGRARLVGQSQLHCPATEHRATLMMLYAAGEGERAIQFELCPECKGFFLDTGETGALDALHALETSEHKGTSGARFAAPPDAGRNARAVEQARAESKRSFFLDLVSDVLEAGASGLAAGALDASHHHHGHAPHRRRR